LRLAPCPLPAEPHEQEHDKAYQHQEVQRQRALNESTLAVEKAKNENLMDAAVSNVAQDLGKVFLAQVPILQPSWVLGLVSVKQDLSGKDGIAGGNGVADLLTLDPLRFHAAASNAVVMRVRAQEGISIHPNSFSKPSKPGQ